MGAIGLKVGVAADSAEAVASQHAAADVAPLRAQLALDAMMTCPGMYMIVNENETTQFKCGAAGDEAVLVVQSGVLEKAISAAFRALTQPDTERTVVHVPR
ncbi:hypothetical protein JMJ56_29875 [Belnapia sp. T18]|uniref:Uncharacterized protein n=1 Tax=Belnapia arida TaxID=2804533 RepID=A0ABS1UBW6_9PROT|nr:hypothetical protein [Belnapia arida]MBL6082189.1 hypothetical protein [Belnapia arida]